MRKVELRMNELQKYDVIKELVDHNGNKNRAAKKLGISRRQIDRLIIKYKDKGKAGFVHGNRTRKPVNALDKSISEDIILLYKGKYQGWNFFHFKDFLKKNENIDVSYNFIYKTLSNEKILSPKARKKTKKRYIKQKLLQEKKITLAMSEEHIEAAINHEIALEDSHPRCEKPKYFGELIEQDGSIHVWFGNIKSCLHLAIDKATSTIVGAYFDNQETLNGYYHILYQILTNYGIPYKFFTDNRTEFYSVLNFERNLDTNTKLSSIFFCHPYSSSEKHGIEVNHEYIRRVFSKGTSFENLDDNIVKNLQDNINAIPRLSLDGETPFDLTKKLYPELIELLDCKCIEPDKVSLNKDDITFLKNKWL